MTAVVWQEVLNMLPALALLLQTFGEGVHKVKVYHHYAYYVEAAPPFRYHTDVLVGVYIAVFLHLVAASCGTAAVCCGPSGNHT